MTAAKALRFVVNGAPQSKQRPRTFWRKGKPRTITPDATRQYEEHVGWCAAGAMAKVREWPGQSGRFWVRMSVYYPDKRRRDIDNAAKGVLDGMNRLVYADDAQVDALTIWRHHDPSNPRVEVEVRVIGGEG